MDLIILALSRWDGKYSSTILSLAKVFAREHRVFYVDNPFTVRQVITGLRTKAVRKRLPALLFGLNRFTRPLEDLPNFIVVTPPMTWSINWLPKGTLFFYLSYLNDLLVFRAIRGAIRQFRLTDFVYINSFNPHYGNHFPSTFKPSKVVYHCVDDITRSPYVSKHGGWLEKLATAKADAVITTSRELARLKSSQSERVFTVANAANVQLFQTALQHPSDKPPELRSLPEGQKVITYIGNICHRLDYDLLLSIANNLPDKILLMVGPFANNAYRESGLNKCPNVIFAGRKKLEELPAYLQHSHCCIIPFLCNTLTKSIYPLKINEYLSAGKPVVTTPFSEEIGDFEKVVSIADNPETFVLEIDRSIAVDNPFLQKQRVSFSATNSWEDRADQFLKIINTDERWEKTEKVLESARG